jgi:enamine deaminase RidA (YjgF/YER057c/UK114 family)
MERKIITPPTLAAPRGFSHGILVSGGGHVLFLAGQDASGPDGRIGARGDLVGQFDQVLRNLEAVVTHAGGTMHDVVKLNIFVRDRAAYRANSKRLGELFRARFVGHYPAMALFEVSGFYEDDALIEMEGVAVIERGPMTVRDRS